MHDPILTSAEKCSGCKWVNSRKNSDRNTKKGKKGKKSHEMHRKIKSSIRISHETHRKREVAIEKIKLYWDKLANAHGKIIRFDHALYFHVLCLIRMKIVRSGISGMEWNRNFFLQLLSIPSYFFLSCHIHDSTAQTRCPLWQQKKFIEAFQLLWTDEMRCKQNTAQVKQVTDKTTNNLMLETMRARTLIVHNVRHSIAAHFGYCDLWCSLMK